MTADRLPPLCEAMCAVAELALALGQESLSQRPGLWKHQVDEHWTIVLNPHKTPMKYDEAVEIRPFHCYVEFNGWPAGLIHAFGGTIAAGALANEATFLAAVQEATAWAKGTAWRIVVFVAILAFVGGLHVGTWLEREHGAGRSAELYSPMFESLTGSGKHSEAPPIVRLRRGLVPLQIPVAVTAYSSEVRQTDASPDIAAWGDNVWALHRRGLVTLAVSRDLEALLPPGTTLIVADRMHERWRRRVDLWFPSRAEAVRWGVRRALLEIER